MNHDNSTYRLDELNLDELKRQWSALDRRVDLLEDRVRSLGGEVAGRTAPGLQTRLARRYRLQAVCALLLPFLGLGLEQLGMPTWVAVLYAAGGLLFACGNAWLARHIARMQLIGLPSVDAIMQAERLIRLQILGRRCGYAVAAGVLAPLFYCLVERNDTVALAGATVGLVLGIALSELKFRHLRRMARQLHNSLTNNDNDE